MRIRVLWLLMLAVLCTPPALARVGSSYRTFRASGFAKFFSVTTRSRKDREDGGTLIHLEPGGHQKHIDIHMTIDQSMKTIAGQLSVARSWIGPADSPNSFAKDIVKSFVADVSCDPKNEGLTTVVEQIWHYQGAGQEVIKTKATANTAAAAAPTTELKVFLGQEESSTRTLDGCTLTFTNEKVGEKSWLRVRVEKDTAK